MTEKQARTAANAVMAVAALGAVVLVVRSPKLRRLAWQMARQYATGPLAVWTAGVVRTSWDESASARPSPPRRAADRSAAGALPRRAAANRPV